MNDFITEINGHCLEYIDSEHLYLVDGVITPSITQAIEDDSYQYVNQDVLQKAADAGAALHEEIEMYTVSRIEGGSKEFSNFMFLKNKYGFTTIDAERPVIVFKDNEPVLAGRLDLIIRMDEQLGIADIKRVAALNKEKVTKQLNLYKIGFEQSYNVKIDFLKAIQLKDDKRRFTSIPIVDPEQLLKEVVTW